MGPGPERGAPFARLNLLVFALLGSYGIAMPTCQALFVEAYGTRQLPWAWLGTTLASFGVVMAWARLGQRLGLSVLMRLGSLGSALVLVSLLAAERAGVPHTAFVLYVWKDIYIVVLVEMFWTYANLAFGAARAPRAYGWFCASGTLGSLAANALVERGVGPWGTRGILAAALPLLAYAALEARTLSGSAQVPAHARQAIAWREVPKFLASSRYVAWLLCLVAVVQASMAVVDYQFTEAVQKHFVSLDARAAEMGKAHRYIHTLALGLQLLNGPLVRLLGLRGAMVGMPLCLMAVVALGFWQSGTRPILATKVLGKACDYSLFRTTKEMLYLPLSYQERTFGKALVDVLAYRVAKGVISVFLLGLTHAHRGGWVPGLSLLLVALWLGCTVRLAGLYAARRGSEAERSGAPGRGPKGGAGRQLGALVALAIGLWPAGAGARGEDPTGVGPSFTDPQLIVPAPGTDLSAWRVDCDVFGWNAKLTEVGAVGTDVHRGPRGKHRGEAFLLVYRVADGKLVHNVITHSITHADLPHNPIPLDDARDVMWSIEGTFLHMWPHRPLYKRPRQGMEVEPISALVPQGDGLCTPHVGARLRLGRAQALKPFAPVDMTVPCDLVRQTQARVYWASPTVAAQMVRFDFSRGPENERSARFLQPVGWAQRARPTVELAGEVDAWSRLEAGHRLAGFAAIARPQLKAGNPLATALVQVAHRPGQAALGHYLARAYGAGGPGAVALSAEPLATEVRLTFGEPPEAKGGAQAAPGAPHIPDLPPAAPALPRPAAHLPLSPYLRDWAP